MMSEYEYAASLRAAERAVYNDWYRNAIQLLIDEALEPLVDEALENGA